jgi:hypothetical protein
MTTASCTKGTGLQQRLDLHGRDVLAALVFSSSFLRPVIVTNPSASSEPRSPVWNQPSASNASPVASGRFR